MVQADCCSSRNGTGDRRDWVRGIAHGGEGAGVDTSAHEGAIFSLKEAVRAAIGLAKQWALGLAVTRLPGQYGGTHGPTALPVPLSQRLYFRAGSAEMFVLCQPSYLERRRCEGGCGSAASLLLSHTVNRKRSRNPERLPFQQLLRPLEPLRSQQPPLFQELRPSTRLWPDGLLRASSRGRRLQAIPVRLPRRRGRPELRLQPSMSSNGCRGTRS